ncbi:MAG: type II secretion system GspH family protein, partial [Muribaculaceae bacterium]|nr:type II secretion system GspH family protein [Muribaculaceae bacterium]
LRSICHSEGEARKNPADKYISKSWIATSCSALLAMTTLLQDYLIPRPWWERGRVRGQKAAFTLAEVLITLGIIGVVAAMTIPGLMNNYQKCRIETNLKETYSILQQTMRFTEYDDVAFESFPDSQQGVKDWFNKYLQPHLKYANVCFHTKGCWQDKGNIRYLNGGISVSDNKELGIGNNNMTITLTNGANINIVGLSTTGAKTNYGVPLTESGYIAITIDANGNSQPNTYGKDIFVVLYEQTKGLVPAGYNQSLEDIHKNCSKSSLGMFCMSQVKNNGWEIPADVWKAK